MYRLNNTLLVSTVQYPEMKDLDSNFYSLLFKTKSGERITEHFYISMLLIL